MNFRQLGENVGLEEDEMLELVEIFLDSSGSDLDILHSAIDKADVQQVKEAAHSLKGAAGNLGFTKIYEMARSIEEKAAQNSLEGAAEAFRMSQERYDQIAEAFRKRERSTQG